MRPAWSDCFPGLTRNSGADDSREETRKGTVYLMKKKTKVTIRTRQRVLVSGLRVRCHQCGAEVPILSPENAAGVLQASPREIHGLLASGDLHAVDEGSEAICGNSLTAASSENEIQIEGERQ